MKWLVAILLLLAAVLALTNPDEDVYLEHVRATMLERAGNLHPTLQGLMWMFADDTIADVARATDRRNYVLFSLYRTDLGVLELSCIGILGRVVECESHGGWDAPEIDWD